MLWGSVGAVEADQSIGGIWRRAVACGCKQALPRIRSIDRCPSDSPSDSPCHYGPSVPIPESDAHRVAGGILFLFSFFFIFYPPPSSRLSPFFSPRSPPLWRGESLSRFSPPARQPP